MLERREIQRLCQETEGKISDDWQYIRANAGRLLWSQLTAIFLPNRRNQEGGQGGAGLANNLWLHMAWQVSRPILYRWMGEVGWQVFKSMFRKKRE